MSLPELVRTMIETTADVVNNKENEYLTRDHPLEVRPMILQSDEEGVMRCWLYKRYNGATVLRLEMKTKTYEDMPILDLNRWVAQRTGEMPFATLRLIEKGSREARIAVTHSMVALDVTPRSLAEVFDGMVYMWRKAVEHLEDTEPIGEECDEEVDDETILTRLGVQTLNDLLLSEDEEADDGDENGINVDVDRLDVPANLSVSDVIDELNALIGLEPVKHLVHQLMAQQVVAAKRREQGLKAVVPSPHLVFLGNPGTGKTTVARLIGQLYKSLGLLNSGHVIEADRSTLVAGYIGQTALKTRAVCDQALNGVLFIDEAYALDVDGRDYGQEAIETLLTFMEAHRNEFVLVVAGYPDKMQSFLHSNPGLRSRFDVAVEFPDYSTDELVQIFEDLVTQHDYKTTSKATAKVREVIDSWVRDEAFGNARQVRRLFNNVVANHSTKLAMGSTIATADLQLMTEDVVPDPVPQGTEKSTALNVMGYL